MGFDAVRWLWRYFLLGAVDRGADLADRALRARAKRRSPGWHCVMIGVAAATALRGRIGTASVVQSDESAVRRPRRADCVGERVEPAERMIRVS